MVRDFYYTVYDYTILGTLEAGCTTEAADVALYILNHSVLTRSTICKIHFSNSFCTST
jgi:hypothetical protein